MSLCASNCHSRPTLLVHSSPATTATAPSSPVQCLVLISPLKMLSMVTPSSRIQTLTLRNKVQTMSSLASWSSKVLVPSIELFKTPPPPSEHTSCQSVIQVHSQGIPDGLPGRLSPLPLTVGLQRLSWMLCKSMLMSQLTVYPQWLPPLYTNLHIRGIAYFSRQIGTVWQPNTNLASPNWNCLTTKYLSIPMWAYDTSIDLLCAF